jgi:hypothetical protein
MSAELGRTLELFSSHHTKLGCMRLQVSRGPPGAIIRRSGAVFDGEQEPRCTRVVELIVDAVRDGLEDVAHNHGDAVRVECHMLGAGANTMQDEVKSVRMRMNWHGIVVSPGACVRLAALAACSRPRRRAVPARRPPRPDDMIRGSDLMYAS